MTRREKKPQQKKARTRSRVAGVKGTISRASKKLTAPPRPAAAAPENAKQSPRPAETGDGRTARPARREPDIPLDVLNRTYTPTQTSLKASFRATGEDHQRDQEFAEGYADERWNDEDHFTNKSGDPRIGTHRRKYEPGE